MAISEDKIREYSRRLLLSRMRLLCNHGFYGLLLMHMGYSVDEELATAATDGKRIIFSPTFLEELSDNELDFVMMHEILHVALQHCTRGKDYDHNLFNVACDIVVNSNILKSNNMKKKTITLRKHGEAMHIAPDGKEGYEYTAEEVYGMIESGINIAIMPQMIQNKQSRGNGSASGDKGGKGNDRGKGGGEEKCNIKGNSKGNGSSKGSGSGQWDDHSKWSENEDADMAEIWEKRVIDAAEAISIRDPSNSRGTIPAFAERILNELKKPQIDWRTILNDFIQEEINDYSFSPPDRRFEDSPFFLPDFNEKDEKVQDILFMIDTSGSMSDDMITAAYSEVKGAIDQFNGKLKGWLGFFDAVVIEPIPFEDEDEFKVIRPIGGGGTDFQIIFKYVQEQMKDDPPVSIIILTDGYAPFPDEKMAMDIPVLWLLNNEDVEPPWGKIARIKV